MPVLKNTRYELFCHEVVKGALLQDAYRTAGFNCKDVKSARASSARLAAQPAIVLRIEELKRGAAKIAKLSVAGVLRELARLGYSNMDDYIERHDDGTATMALHKVNRAKMAAVQEFSVDEIPGNTSGRGRPSKDVKKMRLKLHDKLGPLVNIGKQLGMFKDKMELTGKDGGPIVVISDRERAKALALILTRGAKADG